MSSFITFNKVAYQIQGNHVFNDLTVDLDQSQFTSLIGPNGSGKTTFGKLIMGMLRPSAGTIQIEGRSVADYSLAELGGKIGYLFQNPTRQIFAPTVYEELSFALKYRKMTQDAIEQQVAKMMDLLELNQLRNAQSYTLSQGEKQRLAIGAILLNKPSYLVLDEPTTGLDSLRKKQLSTLLDTVTERGVGILLISHDQGFVEAHSQRILTLENGGLSHD